MYAGIERQSMKRRRPQSTTSFSTQRNPTSKQSQQRLDEQSESSTVCIYVAVRGKLHNQMASLR